MVNHTGNAEQQRKTKEVEMSLKRLAGKKSLNYANVNRESYLIKLFGCNTCLWKGTELCPHSFATTDSGHANGICSERAKHILERIKLVNLPKLWQQESLIKNELVSNRLLQDFVQSGKLSPEFAKVEKNLISLTDRMRKQDEGIKISAEVKVDADNLKKIIEIHSEKLPGKAEWLDAEYSDLPNEEKKEASGKED